MPPETSACEGSLVVTQEGSGEKWQRMIGSWGNESRQFETDRTLFETCGPLKFAFQLSVIENGLAFAQTGLWFLGVRVPRILRVSVEAEALAVNSGWEVSVRFRFPGLGEICKYEGRLTPL